MGRAGIEPEASSAPQLAPVVIVERRPSELESSSPAAGRAPGFARPADDPLPPPASRKWSWPELLRHTFAVDVSACARCGGRMRVVATIEDPVVIRKILTHLGVPTDLPRASAAAARGASARPGSVLAQARAGSPTTGRGPRETAPSTSAR